MSFDDLSFTFFRGIVRGIGLMPLFLGAFVLGFVGLVLAFNKRMRIVGNGLLVAAALVVCLALTAISESQEEQRLTEIITSRAHTFSDVSRAAAQIGLLAIPCVAGLIVMVHQKLARNKRRQLLSTYLRIANRAYYDGDFDRAIADYSTAIKVDPKRIESYIKRGLAYREKGLYDQALADFNRTLVLDPDCAAGFLNRGKIRAAQGNQSAAIEDFDRANDLDPGNAAPLLHRGLSLVKQGEPARAAEDFRRVLRLTNHSDFAEPAKFHLSLLEENQPTTNPSITAS